MDQLISGENPAVGNPTACRLMPTAGRQASLSPRVPIPGTLMPARGTPRFKSVRGAALGHQPDVPDAGGTFGRAR